MKMLKYTFVNQKYYKDSVEVSEELVKTELNGWR